MWVRMYVCGGVRDHAGSPQFQDAHLVTQCKCEQLPLWFLYMYHAMMLSTIRSYKHSTWHTNNKMHLRKIGEVSVFKISGLFLLTKHHIYDLNTSGKFPHVHSTHTPHLPTIHLNTHVAIRPVLYLLYVLYLQAKLLVPFITRCSGTDL